MNVAVIGASDKPDRYSYQAVMLLKEKGHTVFLVHPRITEISGMKVYPSIEEIPEGIDTVSMYVAADTSSAMGEEIIKKSPQRIIFNPGAENKILSKQAQSKGIKTMDACTLVLLRTNKF